MSLSFVNINIDEAAVTAVHEFQSNMGFGADFFVKARNSRDEEYFQVVVYDNEARSYCRYIHEGDHVRVTGILTTKPYKKKNGENGLSLILERPTAFRKIASGNSNQQLQQQDIESLSLEDIIEAESAMAATAVSAENKVEHNENSQSITTEAETALQNPHAVTADQQTSEQNEHIPRIETKRYPPRQFSSGYRIATLEVEDELPF